MSPEVLTQIDQSVAAIVVILIGALMTWLIPTGRAWLDAHVAMIGDARVRALAADAVHAVEQTMATDPGPAKKAEAVGYLTVAGVPAAIADVAIESAVHAMNTAAAADLARQQVTTTIQGVTATALPADLLPLPQPAPPTEPVSIVAQLLAEAPALEPLLTFFLTKPAQPAPTSTLIVPPGTAPVPVEAGTST